MISTNIDFLRSRIIVGFISSILLALFVGLISSIETGAQVNTLKGFLFGVIMTLVWSLPLSIIIAPLFALMLRRFTPLVKVIVYIILPAAVVFGFYPSLEPFPLFVLGGVGGLIFFILEQSFNAKVYSTKPLLTASQNTL